MDRHTQQVLRVVEALQKGALAGERSFDVAHAARLAGITDPAVVAEVGILLGSVLKSTGTQ